MRRFTGALEQVEKLAEGAGAKTAAPCAPDRRNEVMPTARNSRQVVVFRHFVRCLIAGTSLIRWAHGRTAMSRENEGERCETSSGVRLPGVNAPPVALP